MKSANELRREGREEMREAAIAAIEKEIKTFYSKNWSKLHDLSGLQRALSIIQRAEVNRL